MGVVSTPVCESVCACVLTVGGEKPSEDSYVWAMNGIILRPLK